MIRNGLIKQLLQCDVCTYQTANHHDWARHTQKCWAASHATRPLGAYRKEVCYRLEKVPSCPVCGTYQTTVRQSYREHRANCLNTSVALPSQGDHLPRVQITRDFNPVEESYARKVTYEAVLGRGALERTTFKMTREEVGMLGSRGRGFTLLKAFNKPPENLPSGLKLRDIAASLIDSPPAATHTEQPMILEGVDIGVCPDDCLSWSEDQNVDEMSTRTSSPVWEQGDSDLENQPQTSSREPSLNGRNSKREAERARGLYRNRRGRDTQGKFDANQRNNEQCDALQGAFEAGRKHGAQTTLVGRPLIKKEVDTGHVDTPPSRVTRPPATTEKVGHRDVRLFARRGVPGDGPPSPLPFMDRYNRTQITQQCHQPIAADMIRPVDVGKTAPKSFVPEPAIYNVWGTPLLPYQVRQAEVLRNTDPTLPFTPAPVDGLHGQPTARTYHPSKPFATSRPPTDPENPYYVPPKPDPTLALTRSFINEYAQKIRDSPPILPVNFSVPPPANFQNLSPLSFTDQYPPPPSVEPRDRYEHDAFRHEFDVTLNQPSTTHRDHIDEEHRFKALRLFESMVTPKSSAPDVWAVRGLFYADEHQPEGHLCLSRVPAVGKFIMRNVVTGHEITGLQVPPPMAPRHEVFATAALGATSYAYLTCGKAMVGMLALFEHPHLGLYVLTDRGLETSYVHYATDILDLPGSIAEPMPRLQDVDDRHQKTDSAHWAPAALRRE